MIRLRRATVADIPLLRTWDDDPVVAAATGGDGSHEWDVEIPRDVAWREFLIAEADGVPVGFVCIIDALEEDSHYWGLHEQPGAWALDIWIGSAEHRGRGYGESMMRQALDRCFDLHGATTVLIDPIASNRDAIRFYERLGFTLVGERWFDTDLCAVYRFDPPPGPADQPDGSSVAAMTHVQIVLDCTDAVAQAQWWATTLDWHFEWLDPALFEQLKSQGFCTDADVVTVDGNLTWREGAAINSGGERAAQQRIYFQAVPEPKVVKNRMHVDVQVGPDRVEATVRSLVARGASEIGAGVQGPHHWVVMADPEGNEFCVS